MEKENKEDATLSGNGTVEHGILEFFVVIVVVFVCSFHLRYSDWTVLHGL